MKFRKKPIVVGAERMQKGARTMSDLKLTTTSRGFDVVEFKDHYSVQCSIQKSSLACTDAIWLGVDDANPLVLASQAKSYGIDTAQQTGWVPYPIPEDVLITTSMLLTREQVEKLIPVLQLFVETGDITRNQEDE